MSSEDVKAEEIFLSCETDGSENLFFFQHERGEEKNCFLNPINRTGRSYSWFVQIEEEESSELFIIFGVFNNLGAPRLLR
jgi:hypothetical protein